MPDTGLLGTDDSLLGQIALGSGGDSTLVLYAQTAIHLAVSLDPSAVSAQTGIVLGSSARATVVPSVLSGLSHLIAENRAEVPFSWAEVPTGDLYIANGVDPLLKWDGRQAVAQTVGVPAPDHAPVLASFFNMGTLTGTYVAYIRFLDALGNPSDPSPVSNQVTLDHTGGISFSGLSYAPDPKVVKLQVLRNTSGQKTTFYVDVETSDVTIDILTSTKTDAELLASEPVPFFAPDGSPLATLYGVPPAWKRALCVHSGRVFLAGEVAFTKGSIRVMFSSPLVIGTGTNWPETMAGRALAVPGATRTYTIQSVDVASQTLRIDLPWAEPSDPYSAYAIRPTQDQRRLIYWSEASLPESWPASNSLEITEDSDEVMGLMAQGSFVYILERRHIYKLTFKNDPATDGYVFQVAQRGCLNHRLWVQVDDTAYLMDERGIYAFDGSDSTEPVSDPIQGVFRGDDPLLPHVNWEADQELWHAVHDFAHLTVRFFVALTGARLPRHALCYQYRDKRWWIEEYPLGLSASCRVLLGRRRTLAAGRARTVVALEEGFLDGYAGSFSRGTVESAAPLSLTDPSRVFDPLTAIGHPVALVDGQGRGQLRRVESVSSDGSALMLDRPWTVLPAPGDAYQLGGFNYLWKSGWLALGLQESATDRSVEMVFRPLVLPQLPTPNSQSPSLDIGLAYDHDEAYRPWAWTGAADGIRTEKGDTRAAVDLSYTGGYVRLGLDGHADVLGRTDRHLCVTLAGVQPDALVQVYQLTVRGREGG